MFGTILMRTVGLSWQHLYELHDSDVLMGTMASQITSLMIVCLTVDSGTVHKKVLRPRDTGLCVRNSSVTDELPAQMVSNEENDFIWWRHQDK